MGRPGAAAAAAAAASALTALVQGMHHVDPHHSTGRAHVEAVQGVGGGELREGEGQRRVGGVFKGAVVAEGEAAYRDGHAVQGVALKPLQPELFQAGQRGDSDGTKLGLAPLHLRAAYLQAPQAKKGCWGGHRREDPSLQARRVAPPAALELIPGGWGAGADAQRVHGR